MLLAHKRVILYFCRIGAHVPFSHPLFEALCQSLPIWIFYWGFSNTDSSFLKLKWAWGFHYSIFRAGPGSKVAFGDWTPSPKSLLSLQEHIHCVQSCENWNRLKSARVWKPREHQASFKTWEEGIKWWPACFYQAMTCVSDHVRSLLV